MRTSPLNEGREEREEEKPDELSDLLSIVSHDVKNGLNVINLGAHQLASMKGVDPEVAARLKRIAEMLTRSSRRMGDLMRDIVDLARLEAQMLVLDARSFHINDAIKIGVEVNTRDAEERRVSIDLALEGNLCAQGDPERTANVVSILVSNAVRVSPEGARITVTAAASAERVRVEVRDRGPGIAASELQELFERPKPKRGQKRSLGRGLPLARGVILAQNGTIEVESKPGEGTAMIFTLPLGTP